jgi:5-hydroxyisourate hydrolase-like protein (transthyretin family)
LVRVVSVLFLLAAALGAVPVATANADDLLPTELAVVVTAGRADASTTVTVTLTQAGAPLAGQPVVLERRTSGTWSTVASLTTDDAGRAAASAVLARVPEENVFRATYAGDATYASSASAEVAGKLVRRATYVRISGPSRIVDETSVRLTARRRTWGGVPVPGPVRVYRRVPGAWSYVRTVRLGADGNGSWQVRTRVDTRWRVVAPALPWAAAATSEVHRLDNVPPAPPVVLPEDAPAPRITLPPQRRAVGAGPNPKVTAIPDAVWRTMVGRSWHSGCPVGRSQLRLVRINYWAFDGYRRRGELVVRAGAASTFVRGFTALYRLQLPSARCTSWTGSAGRPGCRAPTTTVRWPPTTPPPSTAAVS